MDTKTKILEEMGAIDIRDHDFSSDSWHGLTDDERRRFEDMYLDAVKESDLPQATKQAKMMQLTMSGGLTLASAYQRYVRGYDDWFY